ncbi:uncharacterized protein PAC_18849 [Phialocephala subalpina]|uniref:Uncharacterized protein n=1 Tax=Phialocephala subalpina TaxID=576137 RepID=A0A1L7XVB4_9HELO|nr:uncharacterized protein PAC_18849 [Phialocephala subalpina]
MDQRRSGPELVRGAIHVAIQPSQFNNLFKPIIATYNLESYGFALRQIMHPTMLNQGRPQPGKFWQGGWIFADTRSPIWPDVQNVLLPTAQMDVAYKDLMTYEDKVGKCLGYPVPRHPRKTDYNVMQYIDETERQVLAKLRGKSPDDVEVVGF